MGVITPPNKCWLFHIGIVEYLAWFTLLICIAALTVPVTVPQYQLLALLIQLLDFAQQDKQQGLYMCG